jgi:hypothetical protein
VWGIVLSFKHLDRSKALHRVVDIGICCHVNDRALGLMPDSSCPYLNAKLESSCFYISVDIESPSSAAESVGSDDQKPDGDDLIFQIVVSVRVYFVESRGLLKVMNIKLNKS